MKIMLRVFSLPSGHFGFVTFITELQNQAIQAFQRPQIVTEEGFEDSHECDDGSRHIPV